MFKLIFAPLVDFGGFDSRQAYWFIYSRSSGALRCAVYGHKKSGSTKNRNDRSRNDQDSHEEIEKHIGAF